MRSYWWSLYGSFEADASGLYPQACQVVAHYRHLSGFSRDRLAAQLGIKGPAQYYAEREGRGLDSLARLRTLRALLDIPPVLLGLCDTPGSAGWWLTEYENWPGASDGWPEAGAVVKTYRREKDWTQANLADALGITELMVRKMENSGSSLDSLTRRRALRFLLGIPPILLGLDNEHIAKEFGRAWSGSKQGPTPELISSLRTYTNSLFANYHASDHVQDRVSETLTWLEQAREIRMMTQGDDKLQMLGAESLGYQALANITNQSSPDTLAFSYANKAVQLARAANNGDLLCVSLQRKATTLMNRGYTDLAQRALDEALSIPVQDKSLRLCRYGEAARILADGASDKQARSLVFSLLEKYQPVTGRDTFHLRCDAMCVAIRTAQTYNLLATHALQPQTRDLLRRSSNLLSGLSPDFVRHSALTKLTLAQAYAGLGELEYAATLTIETLPLMERMKNLLYLPQCAQIYRMLYASSLRRNPRTARLGLYLHERGIL